MKTVNLSNYGVVISDSKLGEQIYQDIKDSLREYNNVTIDFENIISMATFCSKQIFGNLYIEMNPKDFFDKVKIINASEDMRVIVRLGIEKALEDNNTLYR